MEASPSEVETRLLRNATPAIQDIVVYALNTGSRIGEIFSLRWQNVDFERGLINAFGAGLQLAFKKEIKGVTWHRLRHTFAPRLLDRGMDIVTAKELLGHSTVTVTMRYTHSNLASKVSAVRKLARTATLLLHPVSRMSQIGR